MQMLIGNYCLSYASLLQRIPQTLIQQSFNLSIPDLFHIFLFFANVEVADEFAEGLVLGDLIVLLNQILFAIAKFSK